MNLAFKLLAVSAALSTVCEAQHLTRRERFERDSKVVRTRPDALVKAAEANGDRGFAERLEKGRAALGRLATRGHVARSFAAADSTKKMVEERVAAAKAMMGDDVLTSDASILSANAPFQDYFYDGDLLLTQEQIEALEKQADPSSRAKRGAPIVTVPRWPKNQPIPYFFSPNYPEENRARIRQSIEEIAKNTCLTFVESSAPVNKIEIVNGAGCSSYLGMTSGTQSISLQHGRWGSICMAPGIVQHEFMHALGIDHTQTRHDRDGYVTIAFDKILPRYAGNFQRLSERDNNNFKVPYDYGSVMHYSTAASFSYDNSHILLPKDLNYMYSMGQRKFFTSNDIKMINSLYKCEESCSNKVPCLNGGSQNPKNCDVCLCNDFFEGKYCEERKHGYELFKNTKTVAYDFNFTWGLTMAYNSAILEASKYDHSRHLIHRHVFEAPPGGRIRVRVYMITEPLCMGGCDYGAAMVFDGDLAGQGISLCCKDFDYVTTTNILGLKGVFPYGRSQKYTFSVELV